VDSFFAEHGAFAAALVSVLAAGWVVLGTALVRVKFGHIDDHQQRQDMRLGELEDDMTKLKGEKIEVATEVKNLSRLLERHFKEMDDLRKTNDSDHREIKTLIRNKHAEPA
jgi:hypothetical protein